MSNFFKIFEDSSFFSWLKGKKSSEQKVVLTRPQRNLIEELRAIHPSCLIRVLVGNLPTLIPSKNGLRKFIDPFRDLFEGLTVFDSYGNLVGGMAERWEEEPSGLTWKFFLRKNVRWSDGRVITAHDFVWGWQSVFSGHLHKAEHVEDYRSLASLRRVLSKIFPLKNGLEILKGRVGVEFLGVRAVDKRILEIQLERPVNATLFLSVLSDPRWSPLCEEYVKRLTDREDDLPAQEAALCASNGAFCLEHYILGKEIELKKNPHYYAANKVFWPRVKYLLLHDAETRIRLWDSGYIDL